MNLSIILPVYNVEQTLQRCVKSVLEQSFTNYEIILIDDGSTDKSGQMIDSLAETDNRCTAIHQPNRGLSAARNTGIEIAIYRLRRLHSTRNAHRPDEYS